jgi:menaquinone-9 beta-reductase
MNNPKNTFKVLIIGGGPAGMATALNLVGRDPSLLDEIVILEREAHPRMKLCGGAVTYHGAEQLAALGAKIDAPVFSVNKLLFRLGQLEFAVPFPDSMRIFEREAFDSALYKVVCERGVHLRDHHRVLDLHRTESGYKVITDQGDYCADVVVAADGANSTVRHKLGMFSKVGVARLLRVLTDILPQHQHLWDERAAIFDFTPILHGIQGYMWDFPCYKAEKPTMNYGIFDSRFDPVPLQQRAGGHGHFKNIFDVELAARDVDLDALTLRGHPVRWFHPDNTFAKPHVLLVGDAAGVDPLFAEGISFGLEYGVHAADAILEAQRTGDYSFSTYRENLLNSHMGRLLSRRAYVAKHLYAHQHPWFWRWLWRAAAVSPHVVQQQIGNALALLPPVRQ